MQITDPVLVQMSPDFQVISMQILEAKQVIVTVRERNTRRGLLGVLQSNTTYHAVDILFEYFYSVTFRPRYFLLQVAVSKETEPGLKVEHGGISFKETNVLIIAFEEK